MSRAEELIGMSLGTAIGIGLGLDDPGGGGEEISYSALADFVGDVNAANDVDLPDVESGDGDAHNGNKSARAYSDEGINDLDEFFRVMKEYHRTKGVWGYRLTALRRLVTTTIGILCYVFLSMIFDWGELSLCVERMTTQPAGHLCSLFTPGGSTTTTTTTESVGSYGWWICSWVICVELFIYWLFILYRVRKAFVWGWRMKMFYQHALGITDQEMSTGQYSWRSIVERMVTLQSDGRLGSIKKRIDHSIVNAYLLRVDNFISALVKHDVLRADGFTPSLSRCCRPRRCRRCCCFCSDEVDGAGGVSGVGGEDRMDGVDEDVQSVRRRSNSGGGGGAGGSSSANISHIIINLSHTRAMIMLIETFLIPKIATSGWIKRNEQQFLMWREHPRRWKIVVAIVSLILAVLTPSMVAFYFGMSLLVFLERVASREYGMSNRDWTNYAKLKARQYNEIEEECTHRLAQSSAHANRLMSFYPNVFKAHIVFMLGLPFSIIVGAILLLGVFGQSYLTRVELAGFPLIYVLSVFTPVAYILRSLGSSLEGHDHAATSSSSSPPPQKEQVVEALVECGIIDTMDGQRLNVDKVAYSLSQKLERLYRPRVINFLNELAGIICISYVFWIVVGRNGASLWTFLDAHSTNDVNIGVVCTDSVERSRPPSRASSHAAAPDHLKRDDEEELFRQASMGDSLSSLRAIGRTVDRKSYAVGDIIVSQV